MYNKDIDLAAWAEAILDQKDVIREAQAKLARMEYELITDLAAAGLTHCLSINWSRLRREVRR